LAFSIPCFAAQKSSAPRTSTQAVSSTVCHRRVQELGDITDDQMRGWPHSELLATRKFLETCLAKFESSFSRNETLIINSWDDDLAALLQMPPMRGPGRREASEQRLEAQERAAAEKEEENKMLKSGSVDLYPLDIGATFTFDLSGKNECTAESTQKLDCKPSGVFFAAIAGQRGHEYLVGCKEDFTDDTCMGIRTGTYTITVHGHTMTVWNSGMAKVNIQTGKTISRLTPVFSVLTQLK
jgi:hypothetical protein